ncbi:MAG TPA: hypothetical protein VFV86_07310 [Nitrososphaeraceae archaeon]|nr:hypothetical protein [Nitrososphaeraceae archaeon]
MKNLVIAISSSHYVVITTIIVYVLLAPIFFEMDNNAHGEKGENFVVIDNDNDNMTYSQQTIETQCKSPCPSSAEMCIAMCA